MSIQLPLPEPGSRGRMLREALPDRPLAIVGSPFALAARLVEKSGFPAVYLSGAAFSAGLLGIPDIGLISLEQLVDQTARLSGSVSIPVIVDADTGFGGPDEVVACVQKLEAAGAAAIQIEDQNDDKRCGHLTGKQVIETNLMAEKIAAACQGRISPDTIIIARTDIRGVTSLDDCLSRINAYLKAGADWIFPEALRSREEFALVGETLHQSNGIGLANMTEFGHSPLLELEDLGHLGFAAVLYPVTLLRLAMKAIEVGLDLLADEGTQRSLLDLMQNREELYALLDYDPSKPDSWRRHLLPTDDTPHQNL